jgi:hypothetical protein
MVKRRQSLVFPREVLLVEIERHCADESCNARTRVGLTKQEARLYAGFECERCERWHADGLAERDIPDWWEELTVTGLATLRGDKAPAAGAAAGDAARADEAGGQSEVVARLSDAWQHRTRREEPGARDESRRDGGDDSL